MVIRKSTNIESNALRKELGGIPIPPMAPGSNAVEELNENLLKFRLPTGQTGEPVVGRSPSYLERMNLESATPYPVEGLVPGTQEGDMTDPEIAALASPRGIPDLPTIDQLEQRALAGQQSQIVRPIDQQDPTRAMTTFRKSDGITGDVERANIIRSKLNEAYLSVGESAPIARDFSKDSASEIGIIAGLEDRFNTIFNSPEGDPSSVFSEPSGDINSPTFRDKAKENFKVGDNSWGIGGALTLAMTRIYSQIANHQLIKQALSESINRDELFAEQDPLSDIEEVQTSTDENITANMSKNLTKLDEGLRSELHNEPVLRFMLYDITNQMRQMLNPVENPDNLNVTDSSELVGAAALLRHMTDEGMIAWGRDQQGRLIPLNTNANPLYQIDKSKLGKEISNTQEREGAGPRSPRKESVLDSMNKIFFPDMRTTNVAPVAKAQLTPPKEHSLINSALQKMISKSGRFFKGKGKLSEKFLHDRNHTAMGVNPVSFNALNYFRNEVLKEETGLIKTRSSVGYFTHPLAKVLGEVDKTAFNKYSRARGPKAAAKEIRDKFDRIGTNIEEKILPRLKDGLNRFMLYYVSPATNRVFGHAADTNFINDKGDVRATLAFGNRKNFFISQKNLSASSVIALAERTLNSSQSGSNFGLDVNEKLQTLKNTVEGESQLQILDYYYALGNVMLDMANIESYQLRRIKNNPIDVIKYAVDKDENNGIRDKALKLSKEINKMFGDATSAEDSFGPTGEGMMGITDRALTSWADTSPELQDIVLKAGKGSWQYPLTVLSEFEAINNAKVSETPVNYRFNYLFEQDARQSNAAIISLIMGDPEVGQMLGLLDSLDGQNFTSLRQKVFANVQNDLQEVFTAGENDNTRMTAFSNFFKRIEQKQDGDKIYARGIVVAGLYGKAARFMYTEAQDMLSKAYEEAGPLREVYEAEGLTEEQLLKDIASIYHVSAKNTMGSLLKYQDYMRAIGRMSGMLDLPSTVEGFTPNETLTIGYNNFVPDYEVGNMLDSSLSLATNGGYKRKIYGAGKVVLGGIQGLMDTGASALGIARREREQISQGLKSRDPNKNFQGVYGTNFRNAIPVDLIQAGDATLMQIASEIATGESTDMPLNLFAIHDAAITTAGSTLLFNNAYNNIAFDILADQGQNAFKQTLRPLQKGLKDLREKVNDLPASARIDVGIERIKTARGEMTNFAGITSYFDELQEQYNNPNGLFNEFEMARPQNQKLNKLLKDKTEEVLDIAKENGYIAFDDPNPLSRQRRARLTVNKAEFLNLLQLIQENEGLLPNSSAEIRAHGVENIILKERMKDKRNPHWIYQGIRDTMNVTRGSNVIEGPNSRLRKYMQGQKWRNNLT